MKYKVVYKEVHHFNEYVEAESEQEAIDLIKDEKELRLSFEFGGLTDWEDAHPEPIKVEEDLESYRAVPSLISKEDITGKTAKILRHLHSRIDRKKE
tara:strand:+ start:58 stop:348 length:291 start_codon:yes stop_codon:yes gene_type:complete